MFARSVGKRLAVGAATLATGFGLMLSIAPSASACPAAGPWGPWNGLGFEQQAAVSALPFHFHHCAPLAGQAPELTAVAPAAAPLVDTRPQERPLSEHGVRHRAHRHHARHARHHARRHARHARHQGRRFHSGRVHGARYDLGGRTVAHHAFAPVIARRVPLHTLGYQRPLDQLGQHQGLRHDGLRHHHRHGLRHHHRHHRLNRR